MDWIPVSERLPEVGGTYLVRATWPHPFPEETAFGYLVYFEDGPKWSLSGVWPDKDHTVTYWQPLPMPPVEAVAPAGKGPHVQPLAAMKSKRKEDN